GLVTALGPYAANKRERRGRVGFIANLRQQPDALLVFRDGAVKIALKLGAAAKVHPRRRGERLEPSRVGGVRRLLKILLRLGHVALPKMDTADVYVVNGQSAFIARRQIRFEALRKK